MVAIMEPFVDKRKIDVPNGKIWLFCSHNWPISVRDTDDQQITIKVANGTGNKNIWIKTVYAKCTTVERKDLWDAIDNLNMVIDGPRCIGGDFNVIWDSNEKVGGKPHRAYKSLDFINCLNNCGMIDIGYIGSIYTWCNNKIPGKRIWKRLDRVFVNNDWDHIFQNNTVKHLPRIGSDHRPLLIQISGNPMWRLQSKLKLLTRRLSEWSREFVKDINEHVANWEAEMHALEEDDSILDCIPHRINDKDNDILTAMPYEEEIKGAVFTVSSYSLAGTDVVMEDKLIQPLPANSTLAQIKVHLDEKTKKYKAKTIIQNLVADSIFYKIIAYETAKEAWKTLKQEYQGSERGRQNQILNLKRDFESLRMQDDETIAKVPKINHLAYADDLMIFTGGNNKSVKFIMKQISNYENASGQLVNRNKSFFITVPRASPSRINRMRNATGFMDKNFPFNYLGCPIYIGRKKIIYFDAMVDKVDKRLSGWQGKILSVGRRMVLIKYVLQSMHIYTLFAMSPPKETLTLLEKYFANFFWGDSGDEEISLEFLEKVMSA
ncbi:uncharacterized protein LOC142175818 [Nicotiana tabacum]|uniref:Uncharacterized protein LOC142175818 n=1 Tax=Nicotiana tabacum TaxID=4097 RepID=A0AC58TNW9_TOBAC